MLIQSNHVLHPLNQTPNPEHKSSQAQQTFVIAFCCTCLQSKAEQTRHIKVCVATQKHNEYVSVTRLKQVMLNILHSQCQSAVKAEFYHLSVCYNKRSDLKSDLRYKRQIHINSHQSCNYILILIILPIIVLSNQKSEKQTLNLKEN